MRGCICGGCSTCVVLDSGMYGHQYTLLTCQAKYVTLPLVVTVTCLTVDNHVCRSKPRHLRQPSPDLLVSHCQHSCSCAMVCTQRLWRTTLQVCRPRHTCLCFANRSAVHQQEMASKDERIVVVEEWVAGRPRDDELDVIERVLGYSFRDRDLLRRAFWCARRSGAEAVQPAIGSDVHCLQHEISMRDTALPRSASGRIDSGLGNVYRHGDAVVAGRRDDLLCVDTEHLMWHEAQSSCGQS